MRESSGELGSTINRIAASVALFVALAVSGLTFLYGYQNQGTALEGRPRSTPSFWARRPRGPRAPRGWRAWARRSATRS